MATVLDQILAQLKQGATASNPFSSKDFTGVLDNLNRAFQGLTQSLKGLGDVVLALTPAFATKAISAGATKVGAVARRVGAAISRPFAAAASAIAPVGGKVRAAAAGIGRATGGLGKAAGGAAGAAGSAMSGLAIAAAAPIAAFGAMTAVSYAFVGALNPSAMLMFNQALRDLQAVIGVALQPILQAATNILRQFAAALLPVMEKLQPIIAQLAQTFTSILMVSINAFASILTSLLPAFKFLGNVVQALVPVFQAISAYLAGWVSVVTGIFSNIMDAFGVTSKDVTDTLRGAFEALSKYALLAAAHLFRLGDSIAGWFGMQSTMAKDFARGAREALLGTGEKKDATGLAAAQNATITGLGEFSKTLAQAAFIAGPAGVPTKDEREEAWRKLVAAQLQDIAEGKSSDLSRGLSAMAAMVNTKFNELIAAVQGAIYDPINEALGGVKMKIKREITHPAPTGSASVSGGGGAW